MRPFCSKQLSGCFFLLFLYCLYGSRIEETVDDRCKCCTEQRSHDEDPDVLESFAALEESRSDGSCRINRCSGEADTEDVYQSQCKTDHETCDIAVLDLRCNTQDRQNEDECQNALDKEGLRNIVVEETVGTKAAFLRIEECTQQECTCASTYYLGAGGTSSC